MKEWWMMMLPERTANILRRTGFLVWGPSTEIPYWWRVTTQTLAVLPIGWKFASANQNTQIWVVKRQQYGISARVPQASPLGNHWWARKTWWCRLFSQTMINVFFSKWIIRYSNRLNFEESRLKSRSYSWAKAERNKWAFRETLKTKRKQSFV